MRNCRDKTITVRRFDMRRFIDRQYRMVFLSTPFAIYEFKPETRFHNENYLKT